MKMTKKSNGSVAVFGATGHTGRFVIAELVRRNLKPVAIARNPKALAAAKFPDEVDRRSATVDDAESLDRALQGVQAVVNCAGPFIDTAGALGAAALRAKIHYLDVCAEQAAASATFQKFHEPARQAGVLFMPSVAFYGGLPDLMATALLEGWESADSVAIMIGLDSWHPTNGTRLTIGRIGTPKVFTGGELVSKTEFPARSRWDFGLEFGEHDLVEVPFTEMILIPRHLSTTEVRNYLNKIAVGDVLDSATPAPKASDASGRSSQRFVLEVEVKRGKESRRSIMRGRDIYAITAPLVGEAVEQLLQGKISDTGARSPGEVFGTKSFLASIDPEYATFEVS